MQITKIPAKPKEDSTIRVAAYARVSADKDAAFHSLEAQTEYYQKYVGKHPDWVLVDIYSDNAISGTTNNRPEFQRMLTDCRAGRIDLVISKSITRFARNTVILLETIRELKQLNIDCFFEKENMHSISPDGELLITLLAMYAEEEARSASENQKWRIQKRFEKGEPWVGRMLGYRLSDGKLEIIPEEAEVVKKIFSDYLSGRSIQSISKELTRSGLPAPHSDVWNRSTVAGILKNEKYTGNMVLQKTYTPDFRSKKKIENKGQVRMYEVSNSHEPIISVEDFNLVQARLELNRQNTPPSEARPARLFTKLLRCGLCGCVYIRRNSGAGKYKKYVWSCQRYDALGRDTCPSQSIPETILADKAREVLGIEEISNEILREHLNKIIVTGKRTLLFQLKDGTEVHVDWEYKSRSERWTPEMRQKAREQSLSRYRKETNNE